MLYKKAKTKALTKNYLKTPHRIPRSAFLGLELQA